jgi:hypothetical protein
MSKTHKPLDFRIIFISEFTKELIKATDIYLKLRVKEDVKRDNLRGDLVLESSKSTEQKREIKNLVIGKIKQDLNIANKIKKTGNEDLVLKQNPFKRFRNLKPLKIKSRKNILPLNLNFIKQIKKGIHEPQLPITVRHLRPYATQAQIDLGKLGSLARDPLVKIIEVPGKGEKVLVSGMMGNKHTQIILDENEIRGIIERFSAFSKIPVEEGFFKTAVGNFVISAIISNQESGSRFVIKKLSGY